MSALKSTFLLGLMLGYTVTVTGQVSMAEQHFNLGKSYHQNGKYDSARLFLEIASIELDSSVNLRTWVQTLSWLGWSYMDLARNTQADSVLLMAIERGRQAWGEQDLDVAFAYHILSKTHGSRGWHKKSNAHVRKSLQIRKSLLGSLDETIAQNYEMLGFNFRGVGDYDSAIFYYNQGLNVLSKTVGLEHLKAARMYKGLAWVYGAKAEIRKSLELNNRALVIQKNELGEGHPTITSTLAHNCWCYNGLGDFTKALECQEQVLDARRASFGSNHPTVASDLVNIGYTLSLLGDYEKAIRYQKEGIRLLESSGTPHVPQLVRYHSFLASCYEQLGENDLFLEHSMIAFNIGAGVLAKDDPEFVRVYRLLASYYGATGLHRQELQFLQKALNTSTAKFGKTHTFPAIVQSQLAEYYHKMGAPRKSKRYHLEALKTFIKVHGFYHPAVAIQLTKVGSLYHSLAEYDSALLLHQQSLQSISDNFQYDNVYDNPKESQIISELTAIYTLIEKGKIFIKMSKNQDTIFNLTGATDCFELANTLIDKIRNGYTTEASKQQLFENASLAYHLYVDALRVLFLKTSDSTYLEKAVEVLEKSKSFILLNMLNDRKAYQFAGVTPEILEKERNIRVGLTYFKKKLFKSKTNQDTVAINALSELIFNLQHEYESLVNQIETNNPSYYALKYDGKSIDINRIRVEELKDNEALLEYSITASRAYLFVISRNGTQWLDLGSPETFKDQATDYRKATTDYDFIVNESAQADKLYRSSARALYQFLLKEAIDILPNEVERLTIIPDGAMSELSMEAFLTKDVEGSPTDYAKLPYLIHDFELSYAYSLTFLTQTQSPKSRVAKTTFGGFAPAYAITLDNEREARSDQLDKPEGLEGATAEVKQINEVYDGDVWLGEEATESNFKKHASEYQLLHLAMHGHLDNQNPLYSELRFASLEDSTNDGHLDVSEIYDLQLQADLVVLSACNTGTGKLQEGEGSISLSRAFAYAGCPSVIMSLWKVPDLMTSKIMVELYQNLEQDFPKDAALRSAKLTYLDEVNDPFEAHPYFWAGFVLMGNKEAVDFGRGVSMELVVFIILIMMVIIFFRRKRAK